MNKEIIFEALSKVEHPAISSSLIKLGIISEYKITEEKLELMFAFPFPNIPIADKLVTSVFEVATNFDLDFIYDIRVMNEEEKALFMQLEAEGWKG
ncbi:MAG: hypothetical protein ACERKD_08570 [Prolixibacteraceae bacterium]